MAVEKLIQLMEESYNLVLPERYKKFLREGEYKEFKKINIEGYLKSSYNLDFLDKNLPDIIELSQQNGILNIDEAR